MGPAKALPWAQSYTLILVTSIALQRGQEWGKKSQLGGIISLSCFFACLLVGFAFKQILFKLSIPVAWKKEPGVPVGHM